MSFKGVLDAGRAFVHAYPRGSRAWDVASNATLGAVGAFAKSFISLKHKHHMYNREVLLEAIRQSQLEKRGLVTVMNHVATLDDPLVWGVLPLSYLFDRRTVRWTLGADNICFGNRVSSLFFSLGQVLSTKRFGAGPFQPSIDAAVYLLSNTERAPGWVHIFPEGFVHQPFAPFEHTMKYFKWGVSRLILEPDRAPIVVPMYAHGLEEVFPEDSPKRLLGYASTKRLRYRVGESFASERVDAFREQWRALAAGFDAAGPLPAALQTGREAQALRSAVAAYARERVLEVRRDMGLQDEPHAGLGDPAFWKENQAVTTVRLKGKSLAEKRDGARGPGGPSERN